MYVTSGCELVVWPRHSLLCRQEGYSGELGRDFYLQCCHVSFPIFGLLLTFRNKNGYLKNLRHSQYGDHARIVQAHGLLREHASTSYTIRLESEFFNGPYRGAACDFS